MTAPIGNHSLAQQAQWCGAGNGNDPTFAQQNARKTETRGAIAPLIEAFTSGRAPEKIKDNETIFDALDSLPSSRFSATNVASNVRHSDDERGSGVNRHGHRRDAMNETRSSSGGSIPAACGVPDRHKSFDANHEEYVDESEADRLLVVVVNDHQGGGAGGSSGMTENGLRFSSMASLESSSSLLSNLGDYDDDDWNSICGSVYALPIELDEPRSPLPEDAVNNVGGRLSSIASSPLSSFGSSRRPMSSGGARRGPDAVKTTQSITVNSRTSAASTRADRQPFQTTRQNVGHHRRPHRIPCPNRRSRSAGCRRTESSATETAAVEAVKRVLAARHPHATPERTELSGRLGERAIDQPSRIDFKRFAKRSLHHADRSVLVDEENWPDVGQPFVVAVSDRRQLVIFAVDLPPTKRGIVDDDVTSSQNNRWHQLCQYV